MNIKSYWIANFIIDFIKVETVMLFTCLVIFCMKLDVVAAYYVLMIAPASLVLFTYSTSFIF